MKTKSFTNLGAALILNNKSTGEKVTIYKVQKDGTKRVFFKPTTLKEGKEVALTSTLWARLYDAEKVGKMYLNRN